MGVYRFSKSWLNKLPPGRGKAKPLSKLPRVDHFFVDVNGILHNVAQISFGYKGGKIHDKNKKEKVAHIKRVKEIDGIPWESLMADYKDLLFAALDSLMGTANPTKTICLCVDGVAPAAKIIQQRSRRIGGSENVSKEHKSFSEIKANTGFSSTFITPGTDFMNAVDDMLSEWIYSSKKSNPKIAHIYSPYTLDGEGEHKLFHLIDKLRIGNFSKDTYAIDGLDSDLISLMLLRPQRFISIKSERDQYIELNEIKRHIIEETDSERKSLNYELTLKDFVLMLYVVGNDFLPRFAFVEDVGEAIVKMMQIHSQYIVTNMTTEYDTINWSSFAIFLEQLRKYEVSELMDASTNDYFYPDTILHDQEVVKYAIDNNAEAFFAKYRKGYYESALLPKIGSHLVEYMNIEDEIASTCKGMCEGLLWVLKYYTASDYSKLYIYPKSVAPLISDLWKYVNTKANLEISQINVRNGGGSKSFNYISQLMTVMPGSKNFVIPKPYDEEVRSGGKFGYLIPKGFPVKREKLKDEADWFMEKAVLPTPNIEEVVAYVNKSGMVEIPGKLIRL